MDVFGPLSVLPGRSGFAIHIFQLAGKAELNFGIFITHPDI